MTRLTSLQMHVTNLAVLSSSPVVSLISHSTTSQQHTDAIAELTNGCLKEMASAFKPTLCDAATVGKPESRSVFMEADVIKWAHNMGTAANDPRSCNIGRVSNMLGITTSPKHR